MSEDLVSALGDALDIGAYDEIRGRRGFVG